MLSFLTGPAESLQGALRHQGFGLSASALGLHLRRVPSRLTSRSSRRRFVASLKLLDMRAILTTNRRVRRVLTPALGLMSGTTLIQVTADRDSVCAGDDVLSHEVMFSVSSSSTVLDLLNVAWRACPLAGIAGGKATWLIDVGNSDTCIGVMAQQWSQPKLLIAPHTNAAELFTRGEPSLYFRYWCQSDPDAVFDALQSETTLPNKHS